MLHIIKFENENMKSSNLQNNLHLKKKKKKRIGPCVLC